MESTALDRPDAKSILLPSVTPLVEGHCRERERVDGQKRTVGGERIIDRSLIHFYKMRGRLPNLPSE